MPPLPEGVTLEEGVQYLRDATGAVLLDPMNSQPLKDDWWNSFVGLQADAIRTIDGQLRGAGVDQAFGWSIVAYTLIIKALFFPLQQGQLKQTSMMQLMSPKIKEIQEKYKDDQETQARLLSSLYASMDVNPLGGCLPVLVTLPLYWALFSVWRRLAVEKFPYFQEGWLWVPSLAYPNPDFQFKFDWLFEFKDGAPVMGWESYGSYLIFPAILVGTTIIQQQQAQAQTAASRAGADESTSLVLQVLPWISVYFIGTLSLELPQAVSLYYAINTGLTVAQTQVVKMGLRSEIPGYEEYEKTGKFPEGTLEAIAAASQPPAKSLHEAAMRGDIMGIKRLLDEEGEDIDGYDEKEIAPLGYGVATGQLGVVKLLMERGADLRKVDGQGNSLLHYAAGYGHLEILQELLAEGVDVWPNQEWKDLKNKKGQTIMDAAKVNRKAPVINFLRSELGLPPEVEVVKAAPAPAPASAPAPEPAVAEVAVAPAAAPAAVPAAGAGAAAAPTGENSASMEQARSALLAAAGGAAQAAAASPAGAAPAGSPQDTAAAMKAAVAKLKANPEAVEQARKMMDSMPPGLLSMMTGNKMSEEQAKKAMEAMKNMSTDEILGKAETVVDRLPPSASQGVGAAEAGQAAQVVDAAMASVPGESSKIPATAGAGAKSARAVD